MRWLLLYARSRRFAVAAGSVLVAAGVVFGLTRLWWDGEVGAMPSVVTMTLGIAVASAGLVGAEPALDRGASFGWPPRRAVHLVGLAVVTAVVSLVLVRLLGAQVPNVVVLRDVAGQVGLAGVGAVLLGGSFGWVLPLAALVAANLPLGAGTVTGQVAGWLLMPGDVVPATVTGVVSAVVGLVAYSAFGTRRA